MRVGGGNWEREGARDQNQRENQGEFNTHMTVEGKEGRGGLGGCGSKGAWFVVCGFTSISRHQRRSLQSQQQQGLHKVC